ncbi:hypothetical protein J3998_03530 [Thiomicrorhabdus sp. 6S2-11]|uniref:DUF2846 domain-containing protein n=1 Tax=Thiomicrorhabdus marina TaxID=2818442 RepID=A0ABS3Q2S6_9GAMM|nr:hypothetical protein [Thiomicrorhabdus marina]MBO1926638.1 hypothetical protein [Thiomicrorhabdus marina]
MKNIKLLGFATIISLGLAASGCTTVNYAPPAEKQAVIEGLVPAGKSSVYIIRGENDKSKIHGTQVEIGDIEVETYGMTFKRVDVNPGNTTIQVDLPQLTATEAEVNVNLVAGQKYYFELIRTPRLVIGPKTELIRLSPTEALSLMNAVNYTVTE